MATLLLVSAAASDDPSVAPTAGAGGFLIGAMAGAIGGAVAGAVVRGRERRATEDLRMQLHQQRQRDEQAFEERLQRLEAARLSASKPELSEPRSSPVKHAEETPKSGAVELSPRVREFSAE